MTSKLHVKVGSVEVDFEGEEDFLKSEILPILIELIHSKPLPDDSQGNPDEKPAGDSSSGESLKFQVMRKELSVNTIAVKLKVNSGATLIIAACAYLHFVKEKSEFTRQEILETMRLATSFFKETQTGNLTTYLTSLVKNDKLIERKTGVYAFPHARIEELENIFA